MSFILLLFYFKQLRDLISMGMEHQLEYCFLWVTVPPLLWVPHFINVIKNEFVNAHVLMKYKIGQSPNNL